MNYKDLWWSEEELMEMRVHCMHELKNLMETNPYMEIKHAKKLLYQPNNICYDPKNFEDYQ
jgi:hypothetical protein